MKTDYIKAKELNAKFVNLSTIKKHSTKEVFRIVEKIRERAERTEPAQSVQSFCESLIRKRLNNLAKNLPRIGYSMGSTYVVICGNMAGRFSNVEEYATSSKYKAKHGYIMFTITPEMLRQSKVIAGLITFIPAGQNGKVKKCSWVESIGQRQFYILNVVSGYLYKDFHAENKNQLSKKLKIEKERKEEIKRLKAEQKRHIAQLIAKEADFKKQYAKALRLQYSFNDSVNCGNCAAGTRSFVNRCDLDITKKYSGSRLFKIAEKKNIDSIHYIKRMIIDKSRRLGLFC